MTPLCSLKNQGYIWKVKPSVNENCGRFKALTLGLHDLLTLFQAFGESGARCSKLSNCNPNVPADFTILAGFGTQLWHAMVMIGLGLSSLSHVV